MGGEEVLTYTQGVGWHEKETKAETDVHSTDHQKNDNIFFSYCTSHNNLCFSLVNSLFLTFSFFHRDYF